jgi:ubiquitin C-terminal hydrolase
MNVPMLEYKSRGATSDCDYVPVELKGGLTPTSKRRRSPANDSELQVIRYDDDVSHSSQKSILSHQTHMTQLSSSVQLPIWDAPPGILGIQNHGNTCFMNTILQCLSSTDLFSEYFIQKKYKELFNGKGFTKRLVGASKCEVCEEVGRLLETLWSGSYTPEISSHFKNVVSKFNVQYKGSSQHDAQEFLLWLLDRLNDELHHSSKKKAKETLSKTKKEKVIIFIFKLMNTSLC